MKAVLKVLNYNSHFEKSCSLRSKHFGAAFVQEFEESTEPGVPSCYFSASFTFSKGKANFIAPLKLGEHVSKLFQVSFKPDVELMYSAL